MKHSYSFPILLTSLLFVTISLSALNTQVPLWLVGHQFSLGQIGLVGSSYFTGNLIGTIMANWFINRFNARYTYTYSCIIFAIATIGLSFSIDFYSWAIWRFLIGIACAVTWVVIESCILVTGTVRTRGKMLAVYLTTYYLGTVLGQALLQYFPQNVLYFGLVVAVLMGLASLFILLTHYKLPKRKNSSFNIVPMIVNKPSRLGLVGCVIAGMLIGSLYSLMPAYYSHLGYSDNEVANWMILLILSGVVAQMPANWCADKYGRRLVLLVESFLMIIACLMLVFNLFDIVAIILLGATIYTIYPISMAWACSCVRKQDIVAMNQAMLLTNTLGSLVAPAVIAFIMDKTSNSYLFVSFTVVSIYFFILLLIKRGTNA
ncbi:MULTISPECIES: MFS transporter [unclassified Gilliamella]|uniref:MFS transporter n=1 Tax=unclassified Gilliamella TaxID=2685620 RepID=UPI0022699531|nr:MULTISPECIES: MFS transporter [unclassified Gilliamella]MCX8641927.1 MFS transporter [Gilliamella sp. B3835]MCX8706946.1 MFS transporter [Gilliamella sp. B3783]MCX8708805.1 MFS transporter [Gilliamella sp. B3780]MCX8713588.1 MFS transporter [Gilliamella sp. B3781]MCX8715450.1 MFS transporter [Gilliamella sp. B3784]